MSESAAKIVMVVGGIWIVVAVVLPLVPELIMMLGTKEEEHVLKNKTSFLHIAMLVLAGLEILFVGSLKFNSYNYLRPEATTNLGALYVAQVEYFGEHNTYAGRKGINGNGCFDDLKWRPEGETRYAYYCGGDKLLPTKDRVVSPYDPLGNWPVEVKPQSSSHSFTVMAIASVDSDPPLDVWTFSDSKECKNLINGSSHLDHPDNLYIWVRNCDHLLRGSGGFSFIFFSPFLIVMALTPLLWASVWGDWQHYKWVRERAASGEGNKQAGDGGEGEAGSE
jgi:hypothetical protein